MTISYMDLSISNSRVSGKLLLFWGFKEIPVINANSIDTDQIPHSALFANYMYLLGVFPT